MRNRRRNRSGTWRPLSDQPGWVLFSVVLIAAAVAIVLFAVGGETERAGAGPEIVDASSPGPLGLGVEPAPAVGEAPGQKLGNERPGRLWRGDGFRLAGVRRGAKVDIHERPGREAIDRVGPKTEFGSATVFSVIARRGAWLRVASSISPDNRDLWIRADPKRLRFETTEVSIHASLSERIVEVQRDGEVEQRFPVTIGAPGTDTPTGRFGVTDLIVGGLDPVYGCCAIALTAHQPDLPQGWIGGDRVAIHGTTSQVGSASSAGCLRATNDDVERLTRTIPLGAPVFVSG